MSPPRPLSGKRQSPFALLKTRRFAPLFLTQALGAFNDNLLKNVLVALLASQAASWAFPSASPVVLAALLFFLPCCLFSATAGQLADKYDMAKLAQIIKRLELLTMIIAAVGLFMHSLALLLAAWCLLGTLSALIAPAKYALLPQHLGEHELVAGNALLLSGALLAVVSASLVGAALAGTGGAAALIAIVGLIVAAAGVSASQCLPAAPGAAPELAVSLNPFSAISRHIGLARQDRTVLLAIVGVAWFWLNAALFFAESPAYVISAIGGEQSSAILLTAVVALSFGVGAMLCRTLSGRQLETGLIPFGAFGLAFFLLNLCFALPQTAPPGAPLALTALLGLPPFWRVLFDLCALGVFCGFYVVPLNVLIQQRSAAQQRARIIAVSTLANGLSMLAGIAVGVGCLGNALAFPWLLALASIGFFGVAAYGYFEAPHLSLRFLADLLIHFFYRLDKQGFEHLPETGPAVLVCNHVSFVDSVVIMAAVRRPIRFVMDHRIHQTPVAGFLFRHSRTIPIATAKESPELKEAAFAAVARALQDGELIGLFPEGRITHSGEINHFRYGVGRIVSETPVPVIPMALRGLWGSFFSRRYGPAMSKPSLLRPFAKIELVVGEPVAPQRASPEYLQEIVTELRGGLV